MEEFYLDIMLEILELIQLFSFTWLPTPLWTSSIHKKNLTKLGLLAKMAGMRDTLLNMRRPGAMSLQQGQLIDHCLN